MNFDSRVIGALNINELVLCELDDPIAIRMPDPMPLLGAGKLCDQPAAIEVPMTERIRAALSTHPKSQPVIRGESEIYHLFGV